jgi:hypothetical protein
METDVVEERAPKSWNLDFFRKNRLVSARIAAKSAIYSKARKALPDPSS